MKFEPTVIPGNKTAAQRTREFRERRAAEGVPRTDRFNADGTRHHDRQFIAWDGEGEGQDYTLFAWGDGRTGGSIRNPEGLTTREILEFIASVAENHPQAIHVIYGGSYDFNHWLRSLDEDELLRLYRSKKSGRNSFPTIEVEHGWPVQFSVLFNKWFYFKLPGAKKGIKVFDVLPFFQCSFVKACDDYLGKDWFERETISYMKKHRDELGSFTEEQVDYYNRAELVNLVRLADTLRDNCSSVNLVPDSWHGPAAIASKMFRDNKVSQHMNADLPVPVQAAGRRAYAGGRAEMLKYGDITGPVYEYDLCSAYPAAMQHLPSLQGGTWQHHVGNPQLRKGRNHFALYRVRWQQYPEFEHLPGVLPYRKADGSMLWPTNGETWVWWPEFQVAWDSGVSEVHVLEAWVYTPRQNSKLPFAFVPDKYEQRQVLKRHGDGGQFAIKLGLNSMYGKLAQQTGARLVRSRDGTYSWQLPKYHQLEWAGWVTSWCRAQVLSAALENPGATVAFATDAVFSLEPLNLDFGSGLGQWEETVWDEFCNVQAGFYFGTVAGEQRIKCRGVDRRDDLPELIRAAWDDGTVELSKRGFVGLGVALSWGLDKWRTWLEMNKKLRIGRSFKRGFLDSFDDRGMRWSVGLPVDETVPSAEFPIEWINPNPEMDRMKLLRETNSDRADLDSTWTERDIVDD